MQPLNHATQLLLRWLDAHAPGNVLKCQRVPIEIAAEV